MCVCLVILHDKFEHLLINFPCTKNGSENLESIFLLFCFVKEQKLKWLKQSTSKFEVWKFSKLILLVYKLTLGSF